MLTRDINVNVNKAEQFIYDYKQTIRKKQAEEYQTFLKLKEKYEGIGAPGSGPLSELAHRIQGKQS
jgi:hypothetical protein